MGRPRSFDEQDVFAAAGSAFTDHGYEATSVDDLLRATGLHRGSLYQAFGSKRGLFLAVLRAHLSAAGSSDAATDASDGGATVTAAAARETLLDLVLVATLELAPRDDEARALVARVLAQQTRPEHAALLLGRRLLTRAHLDPVHLS